MMDIEKLLASAPENFVVRDALVKCVEVVKYHNNICCSVSGGADSDVMLDMLLRCGARDKTTFVFYDTGLEYAATKEHLANLEKKYDIEIIREKPKKSVATSCREYGVPFWSKFVSDMMYRLQKHGFQWEDEPYEVLIKRYPACQSALRWWRNVKFGKTTQFYIERSPMLKEFIVQNPPDFKIGSMCCQHAKKSPSHDFMKGKNFDLFCLGIRLAEGGRESTHTRPVSPQKRMRQTRSVLYSGCAIKTKKSTVLITVLHTADVTANMVW